MKPFSQTIQQYATVLLLVNLPFLPHSSLAEETYAVLGGCLRNSPRSACPSRKAIFTNVATLRPSATGGQHLFDGLLRVLIGRISRLGICAYITECVAQNGKRCLFRNLLGDSVGSLDDSGALMVEYKYDAWGKANSTTGSPAATLSRCNPFRYRGYVYDKENVYRV